MRVYFLSARPCALKINGVFLGFTDGAERFSDLSPKDAPFCELIPLDGKFLPVVFALTDNIIASPPDGVSIYLLPNGLAIYADKFTFADPVLRFIEHKTLSFGEITLFSQGGTQILFEREGISEVNPLDERFSACTVYEFPAAVILEGKNAVCALSNAGKPFFCGEIKSWRYDERTDELRLITPLNDFGARTADCTWLCAETPELKSCDLSVSRELPPQFVFAMFLQDLLLGADVRNTLTEELFCSLEDLKAFFGRYTAVAIAPQYSFGAGTVCPKHKNVYEIKYYSAEVENGRICNIKREE